MSENSSETNAKTSVCSFCGAKKTPETPLIAGNNGLICEACVHLAHRLWPIGAGRNNAPP